MSPKTKKQFEDQRVEKRRLILDYALEVFATHGFHGSSISTIAQHAGISKGLMYNYFQSKEELLKEVLIDGAKKLVEIFKPIIAGQITPDVMKQLLIAYFKMLKENTDFWRLYFSVAMQPSVMEMMGSEIEILSKPFMEMLSIYYKKQGSLNPMADALMAHALIDGLTLNYVMKHHDIDMNAVEELLVERLPVPSFK